MKTRYISQALFYLSPLLFILSGMFLLFFQEKITFWTFTGVPMILLSTNGLSKLLGYFQKGIVSPLFRCGLGLAIINLIVVASFLCFKELFQKSYITIVTFTLFAEAAFQMQTALEMKGFGLKKWWCVFIVAAITLSLTLILLLKSEKLIFFLGYLRIIGAIYMLTGCLNLAVIIWTEKNTKLGPVCKIKTLVYFAIKTRLLRRKSSR